MRRLLTATTALCLACGSSEPDGKQVNTRGGDACEVISTSPVAWSDPTALGVPSTLFAPFVGTCQAPLKWDAGGLTELLVAPVRGQSILTATVVVDQTSVRRASRTLGCGDVLEADGTVTLTLPEGQVTNNQPVTLVASGGETPSTLRFTLKEESFGPWVSIQKVNPATTSWMTFQVSAPTRACSGTIMLNYELVSGKVAMGSGAQLASWSDTGCPVGQEQVDLAQAGLGTDVAAAIATDFGRISIAGTWADGTATTLAVATSVPGPTACVEQANGIRTVTVPVDVVASTADGRITRLAGKGNVRAEANQDGLLALQLWSSTELLCASTVDTLAYASASCATVSRVTAQLGVNRYPINPSANSTGLNLYIYDRAGDGSGAASKVDSFRVRP
jgi:hypothetical protein